LKNITAKHHSFNCVFK